jgi:VWFA-related protein
MRTQVVATLLAGLALFAISLAPGLDAQVSTRERTLFVSALDMDGKPVPGLGPEAFDVREDGVRREILRVSRATEPIDVALLVDNSTAASPHIVFLRNGLTSFVQRMSPGNRIAVVTLADRPTIRLDYSDDTTALSKSVGSIFPQPMSGMTLLDAVVETAKGFERRETSRAVMVAVFTDGREFTNTYSRDVIEALERSKVPLHAVTIGQFPHSEERSLRERSLFLDAGPIQSGGQRITMLSPTGLDPALERLATELLSQYKVVYARPESLIRPSKVRVSAGRPNLVVHGAPARGENGV